jgi:hypothetical protein
MTVDDWVRLITAAAALVGAVSSMFNRVGLQRANKQIDVIHAATNSMKDELVAAVRAEATATGIATGRAAAEKNTASKGQKS